MHPTSKPALTILAATALAALLPTAHAVVVSHDLDAYQTVDVNELFPATGSNNIDKYDTDGDSAGTVAPFTTTAYMRLGRSSTAANLPRRVRLFVEFDLSGLTVESIQSATLEFSAYSLNDDQQAADNAAHVWATQLADDWAPAGTPDPLYNPTTTGLPVDGGSIVSGTQTHLYDGGFGTSFRNVAPYSIDITTIVQNWQAGDDNHGVLLSLGSSTDAFAHGAHDNGIGLDTATIVLNVDAVPEPSSLGLLGLAGAALLVRRRRIG